MRPLSLCLSCRLSLILRPNGRPEGSSMVTTMASGSSSNVSQESRSSLKRLNFLGRFWFRPKMGALKVVPKKCEDLSEVVVVPFLDTETNHSTFSVGNGNGLPQSFFPHPNPSLSSKSWPWCRIPEWGCDVKYHHHTPGIDSSLLFSFSLCAVPKEFTFEEYLPRPWCEIWGWSPFRACSCSLMIWIRNSIETVKVGMLRPPQKKITHTQKPPVTKTIRLSVSQVRCDRTKLSHLG